MIREVLEKDKNEIINITYKYWNNECNFSDRLKNIIYPFLVDYYFYLNELSLVSVENNVNAFILAKTKNEKNEAIKNFLNRIDILPNDEKDNAIKYLNYLESNSKEINEIAKDNDIIFLLIASIKHNEGTKLLNSLVNKVKTLKYDNIYFWTDETCNYKYYLTKGYKLVREYYQDFFGKKLKTFIFKIELK